MKDSTLLIKTAYFDRFTNDTTYYKSCFLLNSNSPEIHSYVISTNFWIHKINGQQLISYTNNWSSIDSPSILKKYNLDKNSPSSIFYPFYLIPKQKNGGFKNKEYGEYHIEKRNDTFILIQKYRNLNRSRKIYFKSNFKIFRFEEFNYNTEEPDEYVCVNIQYYRTNCFDSLNRAHKLGGYTPSTDMIKIAKAERDTISSLSRLIYLQGDSFLTIDKNKYYLFDFWYLSCSPCLKMMPFMNKLHNLIDTSKIVIIGINKYDKEENIAKYFSMRNYHFLQLDYLKNLSGFDINEFPTLILLDGGFNEIQRFVGYNSKSSDQYIENFLRSIGLLIKK